MELEMPDTLDEAMDDHPHLRRYLQAWEADHGHLPEWQTSLARDLDEADHVDVLYPVGDPVFIHNHGPTDQMMDYVAVEPTLDDEARRCYREIKHHVLELAPTEEAPESAEELEQVLSNLFERIVDGNGRANGWSLLDRGDRHVDLDPRQREIVRYYLFRDIAEHGPLEPVIRDPYIEDIHVVGLEPIRHVHKIFDMMETNIRFPDAGTLDDFLQVMSERIGRPVSDSNPVVDGALPDGSRINIIYADEVSKKGASFTIRKFSETPLSMTQIVDWGTLSPRMAAYLWLCLEYGMSIFVSGETASGKTTTLNASLPFIQPSKKVLSAEDTPEVQPPQPTWQRLITREQGPEESQVDMFDLLKAALRSRPDYIVVGEIRGAEGYVAFQAMQTGAPVLSTFHASSVQKMIQRLSSPPINVHETFMDNLNVALIQMAVYHQGKMLRRVLSVEEIEGYSEQAGGVITRAVFQWDPANDEMVFRGRNNSYVLEELIARSAGLSDKRDIYKELDKRARILERMIEEDIYHYDSVQDVVWSYYRDGDDGLPFSLGGDRR